jgi:hypothetical protein
MNDDRPLGRCKIRGCPVRFVPAGGPDRVCRWHQDEALGTAAFDDRKSLYSSTPRPEQVAPRGRGKDQSLCTATT